MGPRRDTFMYRKEKDYDGPFFHLLFWYDFCLFYAFAFECRSRWTTFYFFVCFEFFLFFKLFVYLLPLVCLRSDTLFCYINLTLHATLLDLTTLWR